ncbi:MAG: ATP synthase F1 subunit gamma [Patescibacteria group bacterium]|jgi:F-type H+-transporting ATPase subunit gamma
MASTQEFRRRIKSVNNTKQITKAMQMIASIKMQKSVKAAQTARAYIQNAWNMLSRLAKLTLPENHPLIADRPIKKMAIILVSSDRGLCGSYNSEVLKKFLQFEKEMCACNDETCRAYQGGCDVITIGKKGAEFVKRYKVGRLIAEFPGFESKISVDDIIPISKLTNEEFLKGNYDRVVVIYSHFVSSLKQVPVVKQLLPIVDDHIDHGEVWEKTDENEVEFKFEPTADEVMDGILRQVLRTQIYGSILEANASMYSAQMVAMQSATDNAEDLVSELKLLYNSVRQDNITREIAEISGAAEAMK